MWLRWRRPGKWRLWGGISAECKRASEGGRWIMMAGTWTGARAGLFVWAEAEAEAEEAAAVVALVSKKRLRASGVFLAGSGARVAWCGDARGGVGGGSGGSEMRGGARSRRPLH